MELPRVLWTYHVGGSIWDVAISADGQVVAAGSTDHHVYVLDGHGGLLWKQKTGNQVWGVSVSPDGQLVAAGSDDDHAYLYDGAGYKLWDFLTGHNVIGVAITPDGRGVAVASRDKLCHFFSVSGGGRPIWSYPATKEFIRVAVSRDGSLVAAGTYGGQVYLFDGRGKFVHQYKTGGDIWGLALDETGRYLAIASRDDQTFYLYVDGSLQWSKRVASHALGVAMTRGGEYIAGVARNGQVFLFGPDGTEFWNFPIGKETHAVAISSDGRFLVAGTEDGTILYLENPLPPVALHTEDATAAARYAIRRIRHAFAANPYSGLCRWFDEFDRSLRMQQFALCHALLKEIREQGYPLVDVEWAFVDSREGALWLCQGIAHHRQGDHEKARSCYERSLEIHRRVRNLEGEGQARSLLRVIQSQQERGNDLTDQALLEDYGARPKVLGSSVTLLTGRMKTAPPGERLQIIQAARESGHPEPLVAALGDEELCVRNAAAAALEWLEPGPDTETLIEALRDESWFVRWRAAALLRRRAEGEGKGSIVRQAVQEKVIAALACESDPDVRRELVQLVAETGDRQTTGVLVPLLDDPDPDVRFTVVQALGRVGDRRALPALREVRSGKSFWGKSIAEAARQAIENIEKRHPLPAVREIIFSHQVADDGQPVQPARLFLPDQPAVHCLVTVSNVQPDTEVLVRWLHDGRTLAVERTTAAEALPGQSEEPGSEETPLVELISPSGRREEERRSIETIGDLLVELLRVLDDSEPQPERPGQDRLPVAYFHFALERPGEQWNPGIYTAEIYIDNEKNVEASFRVVDRVPIERVTMCLGVDAAGGPTDETWVFLSTTPRLYCVVALGEAPIGLEVQGLLYDVTQNTLVARTTVETTKEGDQEIALWWTKSRWRPGRYRALVTTETGTQAESDFVIVPGVEVKQATMCRRVDKRGNPIEPVSTCLPDEDLICAVALTEAPPGLEVSAGWFYGHQYIAESKSLVQTPGAQNVIFTLTKPDAGWPPGEYEIRLHIASAFVRSLKFVVLPRPFIQQTGIWVRQAATRLSQQVRSPVFLSILSSAVLALLLGLTYRITDVLAGKVLGLEAVLSQRILSWGHMLATLNLGWWAAGGGLYGLLHARYRNGKGERVYEIVRSILTFLSTFLLCYQTGYLVFAPGYLWPEALWGLFSKLLWAAPVVAWSGLLIATASVIVVYREKFLFYPVTLLAPLVPVIFVLSAYPIVIVCGLLFGALGWGAGILLDLVWQGHDFSTQWGHGALGLGASIGFVLNIIGVIKRVIDAAKS